MATQDQKRKFPLCFAHKIMDAFPQSHFSGSTMNVSKTVQSKKIKIQRTSLLAVASFALISVFIFLLTSPLHSQRPRHSMSSRFQTELDAIRAQYSIPGMTASFVLPDGRAESFASGLSDKELKTPMISTSRMLAASVGKSFIAAEAVALDGERILKLDDPVSNWLGDRGWFSRLPNHGTMTIRHLLTHSSGLPDHVHMPAFASAYSRRWSETENPFPPESLIEFILDQPPLFPAGEGWAYSDTGYIVLGLIIEKASRRGVFDEISRRFLSPFGLTATEPSNRKELRGLVSGYVSVKNPLGFLEKTTVSPGVLAWNPSIEWTGGGFISNSRDLAMWAKTLYEGRAMRGQYMSELLRSVPVDRDEGVSYGAGVAIYERGPLGTTYGHGGWIPGYCTSMRYFRDHRTALAFQINTDIGIIGGEKPVMDEIELRLARIVIVSNVRRDHP